MRVPITEQEAIIAIASIRMRHTMPRGTRLLLALQLKEYENDQDDIHAPDATRHDRCETLAWTITAEPYKIKCRPHNLCYNHNR